MAEKIRYVSQSYVDTKKGYTAHAVRTKLIKVSLKRADPVAPVSTNTDSGFNTSVTGLLTAEVSGRGSGVRGRPGFSLGPGPHVSGGQASS